MDNKPKNIYINISTNTLFKIFLLGLLVFSLFKLFNLVLVILTSIVIASFVEAAVKKLLPYLKNRTLIVFIVYIVTIGIFVALSSVFMPIFVQEMSALVSSLKEYLPDSSILNSFQPDTITGVKDVASTLSKNASLSEVIKSGQNFVNSLSGNFIDIFGSAFGGAFNFFLIFIISFYLSITEKGIENFLRIITPRESEEYVISLWQRTERKIGLWIQGQMLLGLVIGTISYLGLLILGVKYALVLAIVTAFAELVPFGIFLAMVIVSIFGFLDGGMTLALLTFGLYFILHQFENYLIYPLIIKKVVGIPPLIVILSVIIGIKLAGFLGLLLAIPVAVCLLEFLDDIEKKKILSRNT
jgi:predicted PurR-regulated permease PerM